MIGPRRRFWIAVACGCVFVALATWLSSGTMAPYAITVEQPKVLTPCNYLGNPDHPHFEWTFAMLNGEPREVWQRSVMLRRILFPLLAFPAMKIFGFLIGGFLTSVILQVLSLAGFAIYVRRRIGDTAALAAIALLATYPGIYYWSGLPYPHAMIVPLSLAATIIVCEIERAMTLRRTALLSLGLGILLLGYDVAPFFVPPVLAILLLRRRFAWAAVSLVLMLLPMALLVSVLRFVLDVEFYNENTSPFFVILKRYFVHDVTFMAWMRHIAHWPITLLKTCLWHNFIFLPLLFAIVLLSRHGKPTRGETCILLSGLALFLFNNLAPPYRGWQFRGEGVARIYQPIFAVMLLIIVRAMQNRPRPWLVGIIAITCLINMSIALGPATRNPLAAWAYHKFYQHAPEPQMNNNLDTYGRRPLGFCEPAKKKKRRVHAAPSPLYSGERAGERGTVLSNANSRSMPANPSPLPHPFRALCS